MYDLHFRILLPALNVAIIPILSKTIQVKSSICSLNHHPKQGSIEVEIITLAKKVIVPR